VNVADRFDVVGQPNARAIFARATAASLAHGYLFTGPEGVGKKTFARALAQSLLCETPKAALLGYCGACGGCTRFVAGVHPDFFEHDGALKIGDRDGAAGFHEKDEMTARDLVRQLSLHSYVGGKRIFVLGDVDFTREAANALLKFFEEPPANVHLLVTSATVGRIVATIRSRLVEVPFAPLADAEVRAVLLAGDVPDEDASRVAAIAQGSVTRARALLDEGEGGTRAAAAAWFFATLDGEAAEATWATRATLDEGLETVKTLARDRLALAFGDDVPILAHDRIADFRARPLADPAAFVAVLQTIGDAQRLARTNVSPALVADLVRMALATNG
jgi:hypothetical protein